jgi:hypothetical protein
MVRKHFAVNMALHGYGTFNLIYQKKGEMLYTSVETLDYIKPYMKKYYDRGDLCTGGLSFEEDWIMYENYVRDFPNHPAYIIYVVGDNNTTNTGWLKGANFIQGFSNTEFDKLKSVAKVMRETDSSCIDFRKKNYPLDPIVAFAEEFLREREEEQKVVAALATLPEMISVADIAAVFNEDKSVESDSSDSSDSSQKPSKQDQTRKANKTQKNKKKAAEDFAREVSEKAKIIQQQEREKALKKKIQKQKKLKQQKEMDSLPALIPIAAFNLIKEVDLELEIEEIETIVYKPI